MLVVDEKDGQILDTQSQSAPDSGYLSDSSDNFSVHEPERANRFPPPPPYQQPSTSTPANTDEPISTHAKTNHLEIYEFRRAVKGTWEIDPNLIIPSYILQNQKWDVKRGPRPNLNLVGRGGGVSGDVFLSGSPTDVPVILRAKSRHGSIKLKFHNKTKQRTQISCESRHGSITIYLSPDFQGTIKTRTVHGKLIVSDLVLKNLTRFSNHGGKHEAFLSPEGAEGTTDFNDVHDTLFASTRHGSVKVYYIEEAAQHTSEDTGRMKMAALKKGLFGKLFS